MIAELRFKNFYSFRDETVLSFEADSSHELEDYHVVEVAEGVRLLKLGIIYGANASGKSNILKVWEFFQEFLKRVRYNKNEPIGHVPFQLNNTSQNEPVEFGLTFWAITGGRYEKFIYNIKISGNHIEKEELLQYKTNQPTSIFERTLENGQSVIVFNKRLKVPALTRNEITIKCLPNISVLAAYRQVNTIIDDLEIPTAYLENKISFPMVGARELFPEEFDINESGLKSSVLEFLQEADFNIVDVVKQEIEHIDFRNINISTKVEESYNVFLDFSTKRPKPDKAKVFDILSGGDSGLRFVHGIKTDKGTEEFVFYDNMESDGTLRTFRLAGYIYQIIQRGGFIAIDEIESSLHPKLVEFIIEKFLKMSGDEQMLFTTHYDGLLAQEDLIRKDNIWFTSKNEQGVSELYPLTDFTGLNRLASIQRAYQAGKFGAIPNI